MADKSKPSASDLYLQEFVAGIRNGTFDQSAEPTLADAPLQSDQARAMIMDMVDSRSRDLDDHLQDAGVGLMGTLGSIGATGDLAANVIADGIRNFAGYNRDPDHENSYEGTAGALERMNSVNQYWNSLQSEKSAAFDRVTQWRQDRAVDQVNAEARMETGEDASWIEQQGAAFGSAVGSYLDNPGQIVTDSIAQTPYLLTGGLAKGVTAGMKNGALMAQLTRSMSVESAEKLLQMGIVGGSQGTIEGASTAAQVYDRVMSSHDTFAPGQEAERESAALSAAFDAFKTSAAVSTITGTLASKFELAPFGAVGHGTLGRTTDNLVKALQEGFQETIESGTSQYAANAAGNRQLTGEDLVALDQGVGGAAGQGFIVGAGSTVVTNPRAALDAAVTPLALAGKGFSYVGSRAKAAERREDLSAAKTTADDIVANVTTPAAAAAMNAGVEQTTDTPAEEVELPPEVDTSSQVGLFATGMEYLRGKDMHSKDAVEAFHVLGSVLAAANNIRSLRDATQADAENQDLSPEDREKAKSNLAKLSSIIDNTQLDKWVEQLPMEDIEAELEDLRQNPESFGSVIAHLSAMNPMKMTDKLIDTALEAKSLPKEQVDALKLAKELKAAEADLRVDGAPTSDEVTRSMMQTGFPGSKENDSVAGYISKITTALDQGDQVSAQVYFNRLLKFSNYEQGRAAAYEAALAQMSADPDSKPVTVEGYATFNKKTGKLDKTLPPVVNKAEGSLAMVAAVRKDADMVAKMTAAIQKRTGLKDLTKTTPAEPAQEAPAAAPAVAETVAAPKPNTAPAAPAAAPVADTKEAALQSLTEEQLGQEIDTLTQSIRRRRKDTTAVAVEQDIRYNNLVREQARRLQSRPDQAVDKPVEKVAPVQAEPAPAPVDIAMAEDTAGTAEAPQEPAAVEVVAEESKNHFTDLQPSYPVVAGSTVAEENDTKNHLSQSFTTSEEPGLVSKLPESMDEFVTAVNATGENIEIAQKVYGLKDRLIASLQAGIADKFQKTKRLAMLKGQNFWKEANAHSLYATTWDADGIAYDTVIAEVMAWTGVQQLLNMVHPVKWSTEKEAGFVKTYGENILPLLQQGWVPVQEQVSQMAQKLQRNLELVPEGGLSKEFTDGTMLALAMDTLSTMTAENGDLEMQQVPMLTGPLVQWVRVTTDPDMLHAAARTTENFFPERATTAAGIIADKPTKVNTFYRGSRQKVGKEQRKALLKMSQTVHKLSPLMSKLWAALPNDVGLRLFGYNHALDQKLSNEDRRPDSLNEKAQDGANKTLKGDVMTIDAHIRAVMKHASEHDVEITDIESFFEYEMVVNGRAMTVGTSPQSSKLYRELFSTVQRSIDPKEENRGFMMAVAQGLGIKMDKQPVQDSLNQLDLWMATPSVQAGLAAAKRLSNGDTSQMEGDVTTLLSMKDNEGKAIELTAHGLSAMVHMAAYKEGQPFVSSLSYEIDGLTDGPINLMMLLGLQESAANMKSRLGLGGLWFGDEKIAIQDKIDELKGWFNGAKDLYEIIADKASKSNSEQAQKILSSVPAQQQAQTKRMMQAILHLMNITKLSQSNLKELTAKHSRSFTKKPTQAAGYMQGPLSIVNDLANTLTDTLSERIDAGKMTDGDWAAVDMLFSNKLVYSKTKEQFFLINKPDEFEGLKWDGAQLNRAQFKGLVNTLMTYGGSGLANATMEVIGYQRSRMEDAVFLVNQHIFYAQEVLQAKYKAKQEEEVTAGRLHEKQALSKRDEQKIIDEVWSTLIPHPMLRNTGGLPSASTSRNAVPVHDVRRVQSVLFDRHNMQVSEAGFEDPGVAFAALSIMAAGDGSMMTGFFSNNDGNFLNMFDGIYIDPSDIDMVDTAINKEVKQNWEHDYIGAVLSSLKMQDEGFIAWAKAKVDPAGVSAFDDMQQAITNLTAQQQQQVAVMKDINSRNHSVSHMAAGNASYFHEATPLNSASLGTSKTDPLLELALDEYGEVSNGIRTLSKADVVSLLNEHTFENPILSGLWKVLAPLVSDGLRLYVSGDRQAMADFYQQNERREMTTSADGTAVGDRVYVRAVNAEVLLHELLHYSTKSLVATYYRQPSLLTSQQRDAMRSLENQMADFISMGREGLTESERMWTRHAQIVVMGYVDQGNYFAAMEEFLAYGLTNYHLQKVLGNTASRTPLLETIFQAIKKLFGFPNGTKSDSMLAQMFSDFSALTEQATDTVYPVSPEEALNAVNPELAQSFGAVLQRMQDSAFAMPSNTPVAAGLKYQTYINSIRAINEGRTRMQELADTNLFPSMTNEQQAAGEYMQAMFATGLQIKATENALLARVVDNVRDAGPALWRSNEDPSDQADIDLAQARYDFFFENTASPHDRAADILSMALVNPEFAAQMDKVALTQHHIEKSSFNNWLDSLAKTLYDKMDTGLELKRDATLSQALEVAALRMRKSLMQSVKRQQSSTKPGPYRQLTNKLSEGVQLIGEKAGKTAEARLKLKSNKDWITSSLVAVAGMTNDRYADMLGNLTLSLSNQLEGYVPGRELVQEITGTTSDNFKLIQLKGIAARMVSAIRQTFREQVPVTVKSWFNDLSPEHDSLLHTVIGKMALYTLSQDLKDRIEETITNPDNARRNAEMLLMSSGNRTKRSLMIKAAKQLGDRMANRGTEAVYLNTKAIAGLAVHGGGDVLSEAEMAALENLSTLQALSHLTTVQRRSLLSLYRDNTEGFWKTTALINAYFNFDTQRAGQDSASLNFQKGWIPVEADGRKKLKLFQRTEVKKAERMGWVEVGTFKDDPNLVYMATTIGKTPTLSGGAIHSVDFHMNGIHFHSGLPTDPSIQTIITNPKQMMEIQDRILKGEAVPYSALYDAAGDVEGFQRLMDPAMMDRHTKSVGRISDAAGIWLGRLHEERVAHGQNQAAATLLSDTWEQAKKDKRENEFVNIRQPIDLKDPNAKRDKVLANVWETLPYHTKVQLEDAFSDGSKNPPIWIRRDQLNDAVGYHKASVSNFFTGDNRYGQVTNTHVAALSRQVLGKNAYKYLVLGEEGWQALVGSAKDTIIVKSLVVALNNLSSNQIQLFMITGNPVWNLRVQSQKHKELVSYLGYQQRVARLTAEGLATPDPKAQARIDTEQAFLKNEMRKLSIYPLIEAGEMPTIAEGLSETEEFSMVGDFTAWAEKQMGKLPGPVNTLLNNLAVSKETSLYKGLDRMVQYGDFVAKATMYEWLTTQDKAAKKDAVQLMLDDTSKTLTPAQALHQVALQEVNDEFVNYARLPGRWRTYGEDMGLLWFYNYKLRIMKMVFRRMRKNPAAFLIGSQVGGLLGIETLLDSLPWNQNYEYATGIDPMFSAHETIVWNQLIQ